MDTLQSHDSALGLLGNNFDTSKVGLQENPANPEAPPTTTISYLIKGVVDQGEGRWGPLIPIVINFALLNEYQPGAGYVQRKPDSPDFKNEYLAAIRGEKPYLLITSKQITDATRELKELREEEERSGKTHPLYLRAIADWGANRKALKNLVDKHTAPFAQPSQTLFHKDLSAYDKR